MSNNQLNDISKTYLEAVYGGGKKKEAPKKERKPEPKIPEKKEEE